jgi:hypothetical protein
MGKNIRALANYYSFDCNVDLLATGGEDGAIKIYDIFYIEN